MLNEKLVGILVSEKIQPELIKHLDFIHFPYASR